MKTDVLVIGGGASGVAAGIQAARYGANTLIVEETPWLGGMISAAGVSAFDGNKFAVGGGIFNEFRTKLEEYYGGADKIYTGWISLTCFEPKVGKDILHQMVKDEEQLQVWFNSSLLEIKKSGNKITGAIINHNGKKEEVTCKIMIEATEYGDVLAAANVPYRLGRDAKSDTGEPSAPKKADMEIQDMTYCAILKKYNGNAPKVNAAEYDKNQFKNSLAMDSNLTEEEAGHKLHSWESFITYASLPNNKYLLNWPFRANDYYPTAPDFYENKDARKEYFEKAKQHTLNYIDYIQNHLGHPEWGLDDDEFETKDNLPLIPYVRESRRMKGLYLMVEADVVPAKLSYRPRLSETSIAVGDYFLDHHHSSFYKEKNKLVEKLPVNAPFQIPFECLLPEEVDGLIVAEKSISVSHIVNGCTRLQPVVMLIGQAAGTAAALACHNNCEVRDLFVLDVQDALIKSGCQLFPYTDLYSDNDAFEAVQQLGLKGIFVDNKDFTFHPTVIVKKEEVELLNKLHRLDINFRENETREELYKRIYESI